MLVKSLRRIQSATPMRFFAAADNNKAAEWGIKYDDECLKFEKEWKQIADKVETEQAVYLDSELSELQKKKVDMITDKLLDLNIFEMRYMALSMKSRVQKTSGINPLKINMDWPSIK